MKRASGRRVWMMWAALASSSLMLFLACAVDDSNPVVPRRDLSSVGVGVGAPGPADAAPADGGSSCASYGGASGAKGLGLSTLRLASTDCRISKTMVKSTTEGHAIQCFQAFVAASLQCDGASVAAGYKDDKGAECTRPLDDTLSDADFDAFVEDYDATLRAGGVSDADVTAAIAALQSTRAYVVGDDVPDGKYTSCAANCKDAGAACNRPQPPKDSGAPTDSGAKD